MRRLHTALLAALLSLASAASAFAQIPPTLPPNVVIGRLAIPPTGGAPQAIPFSTLFSAALAPQLGGKARMYPKPNQTTVATDPYNAVDPFGNNIVCTGTHSQCLQEFLTATAANGWPAEVTCQGTKFPSKTEPVFINTTVSITVPVNQDWSFRSYGCNLNISTTTTSGLIFDSMGASHFDWDGKIVYNVTAPNGNTATNPSCAVLINPTSTTGDGFAGFYASYLRIKSPVVAPLGGTTTTGVVCMNPASGNIIQMTLDFQEINGNAGKAFHGLVVMNQSATTGFQESHIYVNQIHGTTVDGLNVGFSATNQTLNKANQWMINNIEMAGTSGGRGIDTYGSNSDYFIGVINDAEHAGGLAYGIVSEAGAVANKFTYGLISNAATAAFLDSGTCSSINGPQGSTVAYYGTTSGCAVLSPTATASMLITNKPITGGTGAASTLTLAATSGTGTTDAIIFQTGSQAEQLRITSGAAGAGKFGFGSNSPQQSWVFNANSKQDIPSTSGGGHLQVNGPDGSTGSISLTGYGNPAPAQILVRQARGTAASPTASQTGDYLFVMSGQGRDDAAYTGTQGAYSVNAAQNWVAGSHGTQLRFATTPNGSTTNTEVGYIHQSGGMSIGTTTDPGIGSISANVKFVAAGSNGQSVTTTVRASGGAADCTLIFTGGIKTGGTC